MVVRYAVSGLALITYRETQQTTATTTVRVSSALFIACADGTVLWRHLQETWGER
ncbi:hypothetical protein [Chitinophaga niastensis]|uniref:hypothetical protein n=1 Tax=Chitinophaga niastensis TaxID=536980 RepID=UPI001304C201|nr:hypothetical protein [Chitinophaga niastensis]